MLYELLSAGEEQAALEFCLDDEFLAARAALEEGEFGYYGGFEDGGIPSGTGAAYDGDGYVYYGSWSEGMRAGEAVYFRAWTGGDGGVRHTVCRGIWENDRPNGAMVCEAFYPEQSSEQDGRDRGVHTVQSGRCVDGLWDGEVVFEMETASGEVHLWVLSVEAGRVAEVEEDVGGQIHAYCTSCNAALSVGDGLFGLPPFDR